MYELQIKAPVEELHETKLYQHLKAQDAEYAGRITAFVSELVPILATTRRYFPYYTRHDAHHGFQVTGRIEEIVAPECFEMNHDKSFGPPELFLLIAGAYGHDLGMTVFPGEEDQLISELNLESR